MAYNDGPLAAARREVAVRAAANAARPADLLRKSGQALPLWEAEFQSFCHPAARGPS